MEEFSVMVDSDQLVEAIEAKVQSLGYKRDECFNGSSTPKILTCYDDGTYDVYDNVLSNEQIIKTLDEL
jgi:hypothetical protein